MAKQAVIFVWDGDKRLGFSKIGAEVEWTMDLPGLPRSMGLKRPNESIDAMIAETLANGGKVYRFTIGENEDTWVHFYKNR